MTKSLRVVTIDPFDCFMTSFGLTGTCEVGDEAGCSSETGALICSAAFAGMSFVEMWRWRRRRSLESTACKVLFPSALAYETMPADVLRLAVEFSP